MTRRRGSSGKRTTRWVTLNNQVANALTNGTSEQTEIISAATSTTGSTILRIVGNINFHGTTVDTANVYTAGLIVSPFSMDSVDQDPAVQPTLDWMYWNAYGTNNAAYDGVDSYVLNHMAVDLRGRRKLDEGESLFFCETMSGTGGNSYVDLRVLVLNP